VPSPYVTRAVGSTTAAGTAQPLTFGRPRQTGRRSPISGIRACQQDSSERGHQSKPSRISREFEALWVSPKFGRSVPTIVAALVGEWRIRTHHYKRRTRTGGVAGGIPRRRGCAGDFSAGQGEGLPPYNCASPWNLLLCVVNCVSRSIFGNPDTSM
jgi:hypothetical protein